MPLTNKHEQVDRVLFGQTIPEVHRMLDRDRDNLGGHHRVLTHSLATLEKIYRKFGIFGYILGLVHIGLDYRLLDESLFLRQVKCPICEKPFSSQKGLKIHIGRVHKKVRKGGR